MNNRDIARMIDAETYEGKPCKHFGHTLMRTDTGMCIACQQLSQVTIKRDPTFYEKKVKRVQDAEYHRLYRLKHKAVIDARSAAWFQAHKAERNEYMKEYRLRKKQQRLDRIYAERAERTRNKP